MSTRAEFAFTIWSALFLLMLGAILSEVKGMRVKMDEILTNAAECGDVDCDDGYDYVSSRETLVRRLQEINEVDGTEL